MFPRGNWTILTFSVSNLSTTNKDTVFQNTEFIRETTAKNLPVIGLNPYFSPRLDEEDPIKINETHYPLLAKGYEFHPGMYGFWVTQTEAISFNENKSQREEFAYNTYSRPYDFLKKEAKLTIDGKIKALDEKSIKLVRNKQIPLVVDTNSNRIFIQSTDEEFLEVVTSLLESTPFNFKEIENFKWDFPNNEWVKVLFSYILDNTLYRKEFQNRALELSKKRLDEIVPLEDSDLEKIVSTFFALAEFPSEECIGLLPGASVALHPVSAPIGLSTASNTTTLLGITKETQLEKSNIMLQRVEIYTRKGIEHIRRVNYARLTLTKDYEGVLLGYALPSFKREVMKGVKKNKEEFPISYYWAKWADYTNVVINNFKNCVNEALEDQKLAAQEE